VGVGALLFFVFNLIEYVSRYCTVLLLPYCALWQLPCLSLVEFYNLNLLASLHLQREDTVVEQDRIIMLH
jgi:hypothetical protein